MKYHQVITFELAVNAAKSADVNNIVWREEVDSTQLLANRLLDEDQLGELPALVFTARQTAGRGRGGNRWWSQGGGLTFSLVVDSVHLGLTPSQLPAAGIASANGICCAVRTLGNDACKIKWPNDVYAGGGKLSGLLVDSRQNVLIIGVGFNLNQRPGDAPANVAERAVSLAECLGEPAHALTVLSCLLSEIIGSLRELAIDSSTQHKCWNERSLLNNRRVTIRTPHNEIQGKVVEIASTGALLLERKGAIDRVVSGVVQNISPPVGESFS